MVTKPLLLLGLAMIGIGMSADYAAPPEVLPEAGLFETQPVSPSPSRPAGLRSGGSRTMPRSKKSPIVSCPSRKNWFKIDRALMFPHQKTPTRY